MKIELLNRLRKTACWLKNYTPEALIKLDSWRPDAIELIGPAFDHDWPTPAPRTIIICAAQRTGSFELCRFLTAAGLGIPHEYFHPNYARRLMARWSLQENPLSEGAIGSYIELLRRKRASPDVFSTKLQYWQFEAFLRNKHGRALFENACVLHLFRSDIVAQFASYRTASETGRWDYSERQTNKPNLTPETEAVEKALDQLRHLISADAGFRMLFALLEVCPIFITTEQLFADPQSIIESIARRVALPINKNALSKMIALSSPYSHYAVTEPAIKDLRESFFSSGA